MHATLSREGIFLTSDNKESKETDRIDTSDNSRSKTSLLSKSEQALHKNRKRNR